MHQHGVTIQTSVNLAKHFSEYIAYENCTDLNVREGHCIFTFFHFSDKSHPLITPSEIATFCILLLLSEFTLPSLGREGGEGYEYFLELRIVFVTDLVPRLFAVISFNIIIIYTYYIHHIHDYVQFYKTYHTSSSCWKSLISLFNANKSYVVGQSVSKDNNFESFWLTLSLVMWHFQKEPNDMLWFFFCQGRESCGGGGEDILSTIYLLFISNYLEFKHYFSLITSSDVKTVKRKKKIISSSEYIFLFWLKPYKTTTLEGFFFFE